MKLNKGLAIRLGVPVAVIAIVAAMLYWQHADSTAPAAKTAVERPIACALA